MQTTLQELNTEIWQDQFGNRDYLQTAQQQSPAARPMIQKLFCYNSEDYQLQDRND